MKTTAHSHCTSVAHATRRVLFITVIILGAFVSIATSQTAKLVVQTGHTQSVHQVVFSPDGKTLASASADETIKLWRVDTGRLIRSFGAKIGEVYSLTYSLDGKTLVSGNQDGSIRMWDVETGRQLRGFKGHTLGVLSIDLSPDGETLVSGGNDGAIRIWNAASGKLVRSFVGDPESVQSVTFSSDGKFIVSMGLDDTVKRWDATTGRLLRKFTELTDGSEKDSLLACALSPDGKMLATGTVFDPIKLWDTVTGQLLKTIDGTFTWSLSFSPDGGMIASGSQVETTLWDVKTGQEVRSLSSEYDAVKTVQAVVFSSDGKTLVTGNELGMVEQWSLETGMRIRTLENHVPSITSVRFSENGKTLVLEMNENVSGIDEHTIKTWNLETGQDLITIESSGDRYLAYPVALSPDGKMLAIATNKSIKIWDLAILTIVRTIDAVGIGSIEFSPDGKSLVSTMSDETSVAIDLWSVENGELLRSIDVATYDLMNDEMRDSLESVTFSPDGKLIASVSSDRTITLWDVDTGRRLHSLKGHLGEILSVAFSPDSKMLASGSGDKTIKLWNVENGRLIKTLIGEVSWVESVAFSPDGKTLASRSQFDAIRLWNVGLGRQLKSYDRYGANTTREVAAIVPALFRNSDLEPISPDGKVQLRRGYSGLNSENGWLWLFDVASDKPLAGLIAFDKNDWIVVTQKGQFDTNRDLNGIVGLNWVLSDDPMSPKSLDLFMRQYYEPGLLPRILKCNAQRQTGQPDPCDTEFKRLPPIADINRVQPNVQAPKGMERSQ